jgi:hypothetical protein
VITALAVVAAGAVLLVTALALPAREVPGRHGRRHLRIHRTHPRHARTS